MTRRTVDVVGVDGCALGWLAARAPVASDKPAGRPTIAALRRWRDVAAFARGAACIAVDMPIGLPDAARPGGRACDRAARALLGPRRSSVFSPPARAALAAHDYRAALEANRSSGPGAPGLSKQAWHLTAKILDLDRWMTPARQRRVREAHPELAFARLQHGTPLPAAKSTAAGRRHRRSLLRAAGLAVPDIDAERRRLGASSASADDVLDALACLVTAARIAGGDARRLPAGGPGVPLERDARGLACVIWW